MTRLDSLVASCFNSICNCCIPKRKEDQNCRGCFCRCGNPCRRVKKRCNECLGIPNYPSATMDEKSGVPGEPSDGLVEQEIPDNDRV